jgi:hypothetical protein
MDEITKPKTIKRKNFNNRDILVLKRVRLHQVHAQKNFEVLTARHPELARPAADGSVWLDKAQKEILDLDAAMAQVKAIVDANKPVKASKPVNVM